MDSLVLDVRCGVGAASCYLAKKRLPGSRRGYPLGHDRPGNPTGAARDQRELDGV